MINNLLMIVIAVSTMMFADLNRDNNTVRDDSTYLVWQDDEDAASNILTWENANSYCHNLGLDGYRDWRLPVKQELLSIVDKSRHKPSIDPIFQNVSIAHYWVAYSSGRNPRYVWYVDFRDGYSSLDDKNHIHNVRCVHSY